MAWRFTLPVCVLALALLGGCRNAPEVERTTLRNDVRGAGPGEVDDQRAHLRRILVGDVENRPHHDPHMRAAAAQGLGELGNPADAEVLRSALLGTLRDQNLQVRMECAIALGKLRYEGPQDDRRAVTLIALRDRLAHERDENGRPLETEFLVRTAMLNSLIALGGRDAAVAIFEVASQVNSDLSDVEASLFTSATDRGLLDRCFEGLARITRTPAQEVAVNRVESGDVEQHLRWWEDQISRMGR